MLKITSKRECTIEIDGELYSFPVRPLTTETSVVLSELYDDRSKIIVEIERLQRELVEAQAKIEGRKDDSRELSELPEKEKKEVEKDIEKINKLSKQIQTFSNKLNDIITGFKKAIIIDYDSHRKVCENIPIENTWEFIESLIDAMKTSKKKVEAVEQSNLFPE